ncbi:MAG: GGDEF domain-containing protein [Pseudomonadota bacterium]
MQAQILTFVIPGIMAILGTILLSFWLQDRSQKYALGFAYWSFAFCFGIILQGVIPLDFAPYDVLLFHWNAALAIIAMCWGVANRDGHKSPVLGMLVITALTTPVLFFARSFGEQGVLIMTQNFTTSLFIALAAQSKWRSGHSTVGDRALLWVFVVLAVYALLRPAVTLLVQSQMTMAEYQASIFASLNVVISALFAMAIAISLIAMLTLDKMRSEREFATIDGLTQLPNRAAFESRITQLLARARSERIPVSLIVCDIDHFKSVNDNFGHSVGDAVIRAFAQVLSSKIRPGDAVGRIGGEEFAILAWNCPEEGACALANRLRSTFEGEQHDGLPDHQLVTASFGVSEINLGEDYNQVFKRADGSLYRAKGMGRNCVVGHRVGVMIRAIDPSEMQLAKEQSHGAHVVALHPRHRNQNG